MATCTTLVCVDCLTAWEYVNSRPQGGGATPSRCPACRTEHVARRTAAYVTKHTAQARRWRLDNPEQTAAARRAWEEAHPERRREYRRDGKRKDPISNRSYVRARRARKKRQTVVTFTAEQLRNRLAYFGHRCWMCGGPGEVIEHVKPLSKGGAHALCNIRPACHACNTRKGTRWPFPTSTFSFRGVQGVLTGSARSNGSSADT